MHVEAAERGDVEYGLRQNQPIGHDHHHIGIEGRQFVLGASVLERGGLAHRQRMLKGKSLHRTGGELASATRRPVGLGINGNHIVVAFQQGFETGGGKVGGAGEDNTQGTGHAAIPLIRRSGSVFDVSASSSKCVRA